MPKLVKSLLVWSVLGLFLAYLSYFFYQNPQRLIQLFSLSLMETGILLILSLAAFLGLGLQLSVSLIPYSTSLPWLESFRLSISNNLLNYSPIKSGAIARGAYLKTVYHLRIQHYILAMMAGQFLWIGISALVGMAAGLFILFVYQQSNPAGTGLILLIFFAAAVISGGMIFYSHRLLKLLPDIKFRTYLQDFSEDIKVWNSNRQVLLKFSLVSLGLFTVFALRLWFVFALGGQAISLIEAFFLQACVAVSFAFSLVPGNLGIKEGVLVGLAVLLGVDAEPALLAAVLDRAASLLPTLVLGPVFLHRLTSRMLNQDLRVSP